MMFGNIQKIIAISLSMVWGVAIAQDVPMPGNDMGEGGHRGA